MSHTVADTIVERLITWGVTTIFGLPGDGINGIFEALRIRQDRIRFVQVRHEESAAFAACAYAKFTHRLGVCLATSGPGGLHLLNGLYDAKYDGHRWHADCRIVLAPLLPSLVDKWCVSWAMEALRCSWANWPPW